MKRILSLLISIFCLFTITSCDVFSQGNYTIYNIENITPQISNTMQAYLNENSKSFVADNIYDITPKELKRLCEIYKESINGETYLVYKKKTYLLGTSFGGYGVTQFAYYRSLHHQRLYYIYSFGSGVHRSAIECFDFDKQEIFKPLIDNENEIFWDKDIEFDVVSKKNAEMLNVHASNYYRIDDFHIQMTKKDMLCENIGKLSFLSKNDYAIDVWKSVTYEQ